MTKSTTQKMAIVLVGPPGSGKGTQADLLAEDFGLVHLESSKVIEGKFASAAPDDEIINREKEIWKAGKLNTPRLVRQWMTEQMELMGTAGRGIVLSGSPRTLFEVEGELPVLERIYGRDKIKVVNIRIGEDESVKRNSKRRICQAKRHPIPNFPEFEGITSCPKDGSPVLTRALDKPETIKVRYATYLEETEPVLGFFSEHHYLILPINGEQSIETVHDDILKGLHGMHASDHGKILNAVA